MDTPVRHPIFARADRWTSAKAEEAGQPEHRRELLAGLRPGGELRFPSTRELRAALRPKEAL